jgi:hypothetical protein
MGALVKSSNPGIQLLVKKLVAERLQLVQPQKSTYGFARSKDAYHGPDPGRVKEQLFQLQNLWTQYGPEEFMLRFCWIQRKQPEKGEKEILPSESIFWNRNLVPFALNTIQRDIESKLGSRNIFLKPRQGGYTTYMIIRRLFLPCILNPGHNGLLISQTGEYATAHFRMLKRVYNLFGMVDPFDRSKNSFAQELHQHLLHTVASNRKEIIFDQIDCAIRCASAEVEEVGQGLTLQHVVATEVARWEGSPEATLANMKEAIPKDGTFDMESTANGHGGYFFSECMRARDTGKGYREFTYHFHTWNRHDEYYLDKPVEQDSLQKDELLFIADQEQISVQVNLNQIAWRRMKKEQLRDEFDEKYPEDDITCFLLTGSSFFDKEIVRQRYKELLAYSPREKHGKITIFKQEKPHHNYIIGADVASGLEVGSDEDPASRLDWSVAEVIDEESGEQVAEYRSQLLPEEFGWDLADLGERYNNALVAVERNNDGGTVILTMQRACSYMNIYKHRDWWKEGWGRGHITEKAQDGGQGRQREIDGFPTTPKTRPLALNRAKYYLSEFPNKIHSLKLIEEMSTFVRNQDKQGRPEGDVGCHDDCVMAFAIAQIVRSRRLGYLPAEIKPHKEKYGDIPQEFKPEQDPT